MSRTESRNARPSLTQIGERRSLPALLVIIVVIALPNVLTASLHKTPLLAMLLPGLSEPVLLQLQRMVSILFILAGIIAWWFGSQRTVRVLIVTYIAVATVFLCAALAALVASLPTYDPAQAPLLIKDALIVWGMNILVFSLWYWLIDSGWIESMGGKDSLRPDFAFFQQSNPVPGWENWKPRFLDYLHLAFNSSTAFSPTDVTPLSHRAKVLMIVQSSISLVVVAAVLARAINILAST